MKVFLILVLTATPLLAGHPPQPVAVKQTTVVTPPQTTVREFEVAQPPVAVTELVPVQRMVPQPPKRFQEVTTTTVYELPTVAVQSTAVATVPGGYAAGGYAAGGYAAGGYAAGGYAAGGYAAGGYATVPGGYAAGGSVNVLPVVIVPVGGGFDSRSGGFDSKSGGYEQKFGQAGAIGRSEQYGGGERTGKVIQYERHLFGGSVTRYDNGIEVSRGPFGRVRAMDRFPTR